MLLFTLQELLSLTIDDNVNVPWLNNTQKLCASLPVFAEFSWMKSSHFKRNPQISCEGDRFCNRFKLVTRIWSHGLLCEMCLILYITLLSKDNGPFCLWNFTYVPSHCVRHTWCSICAVFNVLIWEWPKAYISSLHHTKWLSHMINFVTSKQYWTPLTFTCMNIETFLLLSSAKITMSFTHHWQSFV